jgi:NAD(P)-dependent dehydrogenase (short-subunit alcohol dehydrogenase family)
MFHRIGRKRGQSALEVDVNAAVPQIEAFVKKVLSLYGRIDVLDNNAGYVHLGTVEEAGGEVFNWVAIASSG